MWVNVCAFGRRPDRDIADDLRVLSSACDRHYKALTGCHLSFPHDVAAAARPPSSAAPAGDDLDRMYDGRMSPAYVRLLNPCIVPRRESVRKLESDVHGLDPAPEMDVERWRAALDACRSALDDAGDCIRQFCDASDSIVAAKAPTSRIGEVADVGTSQAMGPLVLALSESLRSLSTVLNTYATLRANLHDLSVCAPDKCPTSMATIDVLHSDVAVLHDAVRRLRRQPVH